MDSGLLKVFVAVAQEKSITLGAKKLKSAQSNVTARIKQLEKDLGILLFHRVPQGVTLTSEGQKLYPNALEIVKSIENLNKKMKNTNDQIELKIASTEANAAIRIVPFMLKLRSDFPNIQIELVTNTTQEVIRMLLDYEIDIGFASGVNFHKDLVVLNVFEEQMAILEGIANVPDEQTYLVYKVGCAYTDFALEYIKKNGQIGCKILKFSSYETILGCVEAGLGKAILPLSIVEKLGYDKKLKITPLDKNEANLPTSIVCRNNNMPSIEKYLRELEL